MKTELCQKFHPDSQMLEAQLPCWPFIGHMCDQCGYVSVDWNWFVSLLFTVFIGWWWNGMVRVRA